MSQKTKSKLGKHFTVILKEMCCRVDADFDSLDLDDRDWYRSHSWKLEEEEDFKKWLVNYWRSNTEARQEMLSMPRNKTVKRLKSAASQFCLMWAWTLSD